MDVLIYQDEAGYAAATASLATLEASVKVTFPSKPPQSVADIVALYQHASAIKHAFDQVGVGLAGWLDFYCFIKPILSRANVQKLCYLFVASACEQVVVEIAVQAGCRPPQLADLKSILRVFEKILLASYSLSYRHT